MREITKIMTTKELVEYMDEWFDKSKDSYGKDEYTEIHVNTVMGDTLNLMKVVRALAQRLNDISTCKSNPRGNIHCYHTTEDTSGFHETCCWEGYIKPEATLPLHGSYAPQDSISAHRG